MRQKYANRDIGIELTRVFACLVVIGVHVSLADMVSGAYDPSRGLINCFLADGVAFFWLITGCFLFRNGSYQKTLLRTAKSIALPMAIYSIGCLFFSGFIINGGPLIQCTYVSAEQYFQGFKDAIAVISDDSCSVVVKSEKDLETNQTVQILDIVSSNAKINTENIKIVTVK